MNKSYIQIYDNFRDVEEMNAWLEDKPAEDVVQIWVENRMLAVALRHHNEPEVELSHKKPLFEHRHHNLSDLAELKAPEPEVSYDYTDVNDIMEAVAYFGSGNTADMLKLLKDKGICSRECLDRMLEITCTLS